MLKKIRRFFRDYKRFGINLVLFIVGVGLLLGGYKTASSWVLGATAAINLVPILYGMIQDLKTGKYGIDLLAATAIAASVILDEYLAGMILVLMLTGGEALEDYAENRAKVELNALLERAPRIAHLLKGQKETDIKLSQINVGDKLVVKPGEVVPVDGVIIEGSTTIDESSLTGESLPIDKTSGDELLSGAVNVDGRVIMRAKATAENSQYQQIIKLVKAAANTESPFVRLTDRYAVPFTILSFSIAGAVWIISGDPTRFLKVIVVATPCPLLLAAPIALISGMSRAAKNGIIVKSGTALEKLASVKTIAFDKTGTLTMGTPEIDQIVTYNSFKKEEVLTYAASIEAGSTHILARAITGVADKRKLPLYRVKNVQESPGHGLSASVGGKAVLIGKLDFHKENGINMPSNIKASSIKTTSTLVSVNGKLAGVITFVDKPRPETKNMLSSLQKLGIKHTLMVTGDNKHAANAIAKNLGIEKVIAEALPGDKIRAVESTPIKPVAFVGDGVNDAPVLTSADVGIALGARGSTAASESADVVIMTDDINQVANSVEIAKRTFSIAQQAIVIGIGLSVAMQIAFSTGRYSASLGAALQEVVDVAVIIIALRAHSAGKKFKLKKA